MEQVSRRPVGKLVSLLGETHMRSKCGRMSYQSA